MADKTVGQLVVDLVGDTSGLEVSVEAVGDLLAQVGAAAAALGAAAAAGLAVAVKASLDAADALQDLSDRTGIATEQLSELQHAAEMGGGDLAGMTSALTKLSEVQALAAHGGQEQARAFAALGVSVRDSSGALKPVDELLGDVAQGLSELGSASDRAAVATKLLGGAGVQLMPALIGGRDGLREAAAQAREFGLVVSGETAAAANAMNDNLDLLAKRAQGLANAVAEGVAPALARWSSQAVEASAGVVKLGEVTEISRRSVVLLEEEVKKLVDRLRDLAPATWSGVDLLPGIDDAEAAIRRLIRALEDVAAPGRTIATTLSSSFEFVFNSASAMFVALDALRKGDVEGAKKAYFDLDAMNSDLARKTEERWKKIWGIVSTPPPEASTPLIYGPPIEGMGSDKPNRTRTLGSLAPPPAPKEQKFVPQGPLIGISEENLDNWLWGEQWQSAAERVKKFFQEQVPKAVAEGKAGALRALERYELDTAKIRSEGTTSRLDDLKVAEEAELLALQQSLIGREDLLEAAGARRLAIQEKYARLTAQAADQEAQQMIQAGTAIGGSLIDGIRGALEGKDGASAVRSILGMVSSIFSTLGSLIPGFGAIGAAVGGFAGLGAKLFADGGYVSGPGGPRDDAILARLSAGEYVLDADTTARVGRRNLDALSRRSTPHFASGGFVGGGGGGGGGAMGGINLTAHVTIHGNPTPAEYARLTREALRGATDPLIRQLQAKGVIDPAWRG